MGSFITDVHPDIVETDSKKAKQSETKQRNKKSVKTIMDIRKALGYKAIVIAIGGNAYKINSKNLPTGIELLRIPHYSKYVNYDDYRKEVHAQLKKKLEIIK